MPQDHLLRLIDRFVDPSDTRQYLAGFYSHTGRPSIDPELLIHMLPVGYLDLCNDTAQGAKSHAVKLAA